MLGLVSLAVRHSLGQDLISTSTTDSPKFIRISYAEPSRGSIKPIRDSHAGRVISYTCGVAISAIFLVMATRMYHRGPGHRRNAAIIAALADADRDIPECDDVSRLVSHLPPRSLPIFVARSFEDPIFPFMLGAEQCVAPYFFV